MPPITFHSSALGGGGVTNGVIASHPQTLQQWMERCVLLYLTSRGCFSMHLRLCVILFTGWSYCGCSHCVIMSYCVSHLCEGIQTRRTIQSQIKKSYSSLFTKHFHHTFHSYKQPSPFFNSVPFRQRHLTEIPPFPLTCAALRGEMRRSIDSNCV